MHELAITQSMLDLVLKEAEKAGAKEVRKINLVIGEMCGFVEECVQFYFDFLNKGTLAEGQPSVSKWCLQWLGVGTVISLLNSKNLIGLAPIVKGIAWRL